MTKMNLTDQHRVRVNDREQLIYLLTEAAEIEHGLMCTYLYAGWSLKRRLDEGVSEQQLDAINRWRKEIRSVAMEEMVHLALVNNMLMAVGSPPHFRRQNFPVPAGYHPSSLVVRLAPLTRDTLAHFVFLERPEGMAMDPAPGFAPDAAYQRRSPRTTLTPTAEDFDTVSHLYRGIEEGLTWLAERLGESVLMAGDPAAQLGRDVLNMPGMHAVTDLASALKAVQTIVEQGEGGRVTDKDSHYQRFLAMADEYDAFLADDPDFEPFRPVVSDPVMLEPIDDGETVHVAADDTSQVLDLANAVYGLMLRLLASGTGMASGTEVLRRIEIDSAIDLMHVINSLAVLLTEMPADRSGTSNGGMNFHLPRGGLALPQRHAGTALLAERAHEIASAIDALRGTIPAIDDSLAETLRTIAARLVETGAMPPA